MLINNTINTTNHFGGAKPPKDPIKEIYKLLETKSNKGHVHKKSDIEDFAHTHDERYYRKDISELQLLLSGNGTPNYEQGEHDDLYIDELNGDLYKKVHDSWIRKTDLKGDKGDPGVQGPPGEKGNPFTYEDFTEEQLEALRGPQGEPGKDGGDYDDTELRQLIDINLEEAKKYTDTEIANFDFIKIVDELPEVGLPNKVYFVPKTESDTDNIFDEYAWINNAWEYFGTKTVEVDLTDYIKNTDYATNTKAGIVGINASYGINRNTANNNLYVIKATDSEIAAKTNIYKPIVPSNLDYAVKKALSDSKIEWSDTEKQQAKDLLNIEESNGDGILVDSVIGYDGEEIPEGYEEVEDNSKGFILYEGNEFVTSGTLNDSVINYKRIVIEAVTSDGNQILAGSYIYDFSNSNTYFKIELRGGSVSGSHAYYAKLGRFMVHGDIFVIDRLANFQILVSTGVTTIEPLTENTIIKLLRVTGYKEI